MNVVAVVVVALAHGAVAGDAGDAGAASTLPTAPSVCRADDWCNAFPWVPTPSLVAADANRVVLVDDKGLMSVWQGGAWTSGRDGGVAGATQMFFFREHGLVLCDKARCLLFTIDVDGKLTSGLPMKPLTDAERPKAPPAPAGWTAAHGKARRAQDAFPIPDGGTPVLIGDADHPVAVVDHLYGKGVYRFDGDKFVDLIPAWTGGLLKEHIEVFHGSSCKPCLVAGLGVVWRDAEVWRVARGETRGLGSVESVVVAGGVPYLLVDSRWRALRDGRLAAAAEPHAPDTPSVRVEPTGEPDDAGPRGRAYDVDGLHLRVPMTGGRALWLFRF